ncbi:MAG: hypothetical protein U1D26_00570, partial [Patescibacteria group bacterium]|nr:hypothetical protein [Patescibacteria group bacterium]
MTLRKYPTIAASVLAAAFFLAATPAFADTSLAIQSLSPGSSVNVGSSLTFTAITSGLSAPITYTISDTLSGSTLSSSNFASGSSNLSWTPAAADVGTHNVTVTATDGSSQTASVQQTITVLPAPSVSLESISPDTKVPVGTELTFTATPSNFSNTSYSFTLSDTDSVSTIKNSNIDSSGHFKWTPRSVDLGLHTLTVQVNAGSQMAKVSQRIDVLDASYVPAASSDSSRTLTLTPLSPSTTVAVGTPISATAVTTGFTPTSYFTSDSFPGTSITYATVSASGIFSWTPTA